MSSIIKVKINNKTKNKSKSPPEKKTRKLRINKDNVIINNSSVLRVLTTTNPVDVDVNTKNPLLESINKTFSTSIPKKTDKKVNLNCTKDYVLTESDLPRQFELEKLNGQKLRDVYHTLVGEPTGQKNTAQVARLKNELINLIICIENQLKNNEKIPDESLKPSEIVSQQIPEVGPVIENEEKERIDETPYVEPITTELQEELAELEQVQEEEPFTEEEIEPEVIIKEPIVKSTNEIKPLSELVVPKENQHNIIETNNPSIDIDLTSDEQNYQNKINIIPENKDSKEYNQFLFEREKTEHEINKKNIYQNEYDFLYPELDDPDFSSKIAKRKEFNDTKFDGEIYDVKKQSDLLCNAEFELLPHQLFVKNFLSFQTPYNALLLYHSLGTGKTCSSIGIAEEMREYMKQVGINQRILIVASPNVQQNFRLQLFDERKLKSVGGVWSLDTCVGNSLLKEINPTNLKGLNKETVVKQINSLINQYYVFIGYFELANYIKRKIFQDNDSIYSEKDRKKLRVKRIRSIFDNRLIIIDEVHNIRMTDDNKKNKKTASLLMEIIKYANNIRLLLLSATPMYNSYKEIIMLTNLLNLVDKRSTIREEDVFDKNGDFLPERTMPDGRILENGRELLKRKLTGYISFVRGENPYTFPFRIYPDIFSPENTIDETKYPTIQMNNKPIEEPLKHLPLYLNEMGEYQKKGYDFIINFLRNKSFSTTDLYGREREMPTFENMESFGYMHLKQPLEALNIVFPNPKLDAIGFDNMNNESDENNENLIKGFLGKEGLSNIMKYKTIRSTYMLRHEFEYKSDVLEKYGRIFSPSELPKYSHKISKICDSIKNSNGIIIVYSQYIDGGIVPLALALEEMGFSRFGAALYTKSLFKIPPTEPLDAISMKPRSEFLESGGQDKDFKPAKYVVISGDPNFSPNNLADIKHVTNPDNKNGEKVKVILITKAAAEGLDFKNTRQVHILEPWYNLNRTEQIVGRGVRNLSHCQLPFEERNVEIYLHATRPKQISNEQIGDEEPIIQESINEEPADMYVYRYAEKKASQIGKITRLLKEIAVDCILNISQINFTVDKITALAQNKNVNINLSSKKQIEFKIGDKPFTDICDYMDNCNFTCSSSTTQINDSDIIKSTYNEDFARMNYSMILKRIRQLFREHHFYKREDLINSINIIKKYPSEQIDYVLTRFIDNKNDFIIDKYGRRGYLINRDNYYAFQPAEITDEKSSLFDRSIPIDYKPFSLELELPNKIEKDVEIQNIKEIGDFNETEITENMEQDSIKIEVEIQDKYNKIVNNIKENINNALLDEKTIIESGENDWYKHMNNVLDKLTEYHGISKESITKYIIHHNLDSLTFQEKMVLVRNIYKVDFSEKISSIDTDEMNIEKIMKTYFDEKLVSYRDKKGILLTKELDVKEQIVWKIFVQNNENRLLWREIDDFEYTDFRADIQKFVVSKNKINNLIGFMNIFKTGEIIFKTKITTGKWNNKGAFCNEASKKDILDRINSLLDEPIYTNEFIKQYYVSSILKKGIVIEKRMENGVYKSGLCVILEILLRYYNDIGHKGLYWFFDPEKTAINSIIDFKRE
jgi:hypothetical protein